MVYCCITEAKNWKRLVILICVIAVAGLTACSATQHTGIILPDSSMSGSHNGEKKAKPAKHPEELAKLRAKQQASEDGTVKPDGLVNAIAHRRAMLNSSSKLRKAAGISSNKWSFIGPGNIGGRIRSIAINPTNADMMWIGSVSGGIWKTTDGGSSWSPVNDFMGNLSISSLVIDPANSSTMYAGTGEGFSARGFHGYGIFKSTDGGNTWNHLASTTPSADTSSSSSAYNWYYVNRLAISSNGVILAATSGYKSNWGAIYRSADGGSTWTNTLTGKAFDVRFDPNNSDNATANSVDYNWATSLYESHILRSTNAGQTWTKVKTFTDNNGRIELAYAPSNPQIIYASRDNQSATTDSGELYKSADGGLTWSYVSNPKHLSSQGWYDNTIWVSPNNPDLLIVGGVDLYRSANGGSTWEQISIWSKWPISAHADHHAIVSHPGFNGTSNKTVFFGNDGGIWKVNDITSNITVSEYDYYGKLNTSIAWINLNNSLGITQFYGGAGSSSAGKIIGGTQDNGHLMYTEPTGTSWKQAIEGDGGFAAVDPNDSNYMYGEYSYLTLYRSTDGGNKYVEICNGIIEADSTYCGGHDEALFIAPFILDPNNSNTMLAGAASLWRSNNVKSETPLWSPIKSVVTDTKGDKKYISAIAVAQGNSNLIWVGYDSGGVYYTTNGTASSPTWTIVSSDLPARYVTRIMIDKDNSNKVYVTFGGYEQNNIYVTTNSGAAWTNLNSSDNIPSAPIRTIVRHNSNPNWLYIGTEIGIYSSENAGTTWSTTNDGPANVPVDELFWYGSDKLVAATHGRGMFMATIGNGSNCAASVSSSLVVHIPIVTYSGNNYWADLQYNAADSTLSVANAGIVSDASSYSSCTASTLSSGGFLHIPVVMVNSISYWLDLQWSGTAFVVAGAEQN